MRRTMVLAAAGLGLLAVAGAATMLTRSHDGASTSAAPHRAAGPAGLVLAADAGRGAEVFRTCTACHTVGRGGADVDGPNLYGVVGARVAERRPRYGYTQALRDAGGTWTEPRLDAWLTDPAAFAPGTAMHFPGLPDAQDRADVVAYLATQGPARR